MLLVSLACVHIEVHFLSPCLNCDEPLVIVVDSVLGKTGTGASKYESSADNRHLTILKSD